MKVSKVMDEICEVADFKFGLNGHKNDAVSVGIYSDGVEWQLWLQRPTQRQLDNGEIKISMLHTVKQYEYLTGFFVMAPSLTEALHELRARVINASEWSQ